MMTAVHVHQMIGITGDRGLHIVEMDVAAGMIAFRIISFWCEACPTKLSKAMWVTVLSVRLISLLTF